MKDIDVLRIVSHLVRPYFVWVMPLQPCSPEEALEWEKVLLKCVVFVPTPWVPSFPLHSSICEELDGEVNLTTQEILCV